MIELRPQQDALSWSGPEELYEIRAAIDSRGRLHAYSPPARLYADAATGERPPLVAAGQGRPASSIRRDTTILAVILLAVAGLLIGHVLGVLLF